MLSVTTVFGSRWILSAIGNISNHCGSPGRHPGKFGDLRHSVILNAIVKGDLKTIHETVGLHRRWNGAVILVTGCAGFLGFYLTQYLVRYAGELGIRKVIGLDTFLLGKSRWLLELAEEFPGFFSL